MQRVILTVEENAFLTKNVLKMTLCGNIPQEKKAGRFVNIALSGQFLRRPISVCDSEENRLTIVYKVVGEGTGKMSKMQKGETLDVLIDLGNGYDEEKSGNAPLLLGGGVGVPPLYYLAKRLVAQGKKPTVILGFNTESEVFFETEFRNLGCKTIVTTADGSYGQKGFVTDAIEQGTYTHFYCCGPEPMLKAVYKATETDGQFSFEERMGCGFGACMGCSCKTITGNKRICKEGPVLNKGEILW